VEDIRHQGLEPHVLDTGDVFGSFEVVRCTIFSTFPRIVHHCNMLEDVNNISICIECFWKQENKVMCDTYGTVSG
jgi:hypothetical protein